MNLKRLEFTLTPKCNSQCIHCQAEASPSRREVMETKDAFNYLDRVTAVSNLESFMIFGGEPMLYPKRAIAIFERAHQLGIPRIEMITNGVWGKDKAAVEKLARKLKAAGVNELSISVDAFHFQYIPLEYPLNAAIAAVKAGIEKVVWNVAVVESLNAENGYDRKTAQILKKLGSASLNVSMVRLMPMGRALQNLRKYFQPASLRGPCEEDQIIGNLLTNPESVCIEPSGSADICWHLTIGNAKTKPLDQIITNYDWQKNIIVKTLVQQGPIGLLKLPEMCGYRFKENEYINKCHLCVEIRKILKLHYPAVYS